MKILILGDGMLGSEVFNYFAQNSKHDTHYTTRNKDNQSDKSIYFNVDNNYDNICKDLHKITKGFDFIINCIGSIKQKNITPEQYVHTNVLLPFALQEVITERKGDLRVVQIATDCVFSGVEGGYHEESLHDESDLYGKSKSLGEIQHENFINIRCSIVGIEKNTNYSLLSWFLSQPKNAQIYGYTNHIWNGITVFHFAKLALSIIEYNTTKINLQHFIPSDVISKYEFLKLFGQIFNREDIKIQKKETEIAINRTLSTNYTENNSFLWRKMGYDNIPTVENMIQEYKDYVTKI